jgi:hypothetical protein
MHRSWMDDGSGAGCRVQGGGCPSLTNAQPIWSSWLPASRISGATRKQRAGDAVLVAYVGCGVRPCALHAPSHCVVCVEVTSVVSCALAPSSTHSCAPTWMCTQVPPEWVGLRDLQLLDVSNNCGMCGVVSC